MLREAGLIQGEVEGPATCYCIDARGVQFLKDQIGGWLPDCCAVEDSTQGSSEYFNQVAGDWDRLRAGYFSEAVRENYAAVAQSGSCGCSGSTAGAAGSCCG